MPAIDVELDVPPEHIDDDFLDEVCAGAPIFASKEWFRFLFSLDLSEEYGGSIDLRFATATFKGQPVGLCPMVRTNGDGMGSIHHIRRFHFEDCFERARLITPPEQMAQLERQRRFVAVYGRLLRSLGSQMNDTVAIMNPLSTRLMVPVSPNSPMSREQVLVSMFDAICRQEKKRILWFQFVAGGSAEERALKRLGLPCAFQLYDNWLDLTAIHNMDEYMSSLRAKDRSNIRRDNRKLENAGISYHATEVQSALAEHLSQLHHLTASKYGENNFRRTPKFYENISTHLGPLVQFTIARGKGTVIGFSFALHCPVERTLWGFDFGRLYDPPYDALPIYFDLTYYIPVRRALEQNCRFLWWGPASYEPKSIRGAKLCPLNGYFHMPNAMDRWLMLPYLRYIGQLAERLIRESIVRPPRIEIPPSI